MTAFKETETSLDFVDAYIERCSKDTETMIATESAIFLNQSIAYLKKQKNEFIYLESILFEQIRVEGISLEADDVFGTYDVMLGLKLQKKFEKPLREYIDRNLHGDDAKFDLMFSQDDGLWELNFALDFVTGFQDEMSIGEAFKLIYHFLFQLVESVKAKTP